MKQVISSLPPGKYTIKTVDVEVDLRFVKLSGIILETGQAVAIRLPNYPDPERKKRRWHP